jgi:hypothetical protein
MRLEPLRDRLKLPILVINDSPIKQRGEFRVGMGEGALNGTQGLALPSNGARHWHLHRLDSRLTAVSCGAVPSGFRGAAGDQRHARGSWYESRGGCGKMMPVRSARPPRLLISAAPVLSAACSWLVKVLLRCWRGSLDH